MYWLIWHEEGAYNNKMEQYFSYEEALYFWMKLYDRGIKGHIETPEERAGDED